MSREVFVDTSGFYSLLVPRDDRHDLANDILKRAAGELSRFATTDYVLDETATLLKARGQSHLAEALFASVLNSAACRVEWTDADRFARTRDLFLRRLDQAWSFTDCLSFHVMKQARLREALTKDAHFEQAGFVALLKSSTG